MKSIAAFMIAVILSLALAACKSKDTPAGPTAAPTALPPGVTQDPYPTQDPARAAFDPDTDSGRPSLRKA